MIDFFVKQWNENKNILREYIKNNNIENFDSYEKLVKLVLKLVINNNADYEGREIDIDKVKEIDYGSYQGTLIYVFPSKTYQPSTSETFYTSVEYGSCSGCDTLLSITSYGEGKPTKHQVDRLMDLCLHLVQNTHRFKG